MRVRIWQEQKKDILRGFDGSGHSLPERLLIVQYNVCDFCVIREVGGTSVEAAAVRRN